MRRSRFKTARAAQCADLLDKLGCDSEIQASLSFFHLALILLK
jgi:hypothetical protein